MSELAFYDYELKDCANVPWSPEEAIALGYTRWMDRNGCADCKTEGKKVRYTENNMCVGCLLQSANEFFPLWLMGHPDRPEPWSTSRERSAELGINYYYGSSNHPVICQYGPHLRKTHVTSGKCVGCAEAKHKVKSPRAVSRAAGQATYIPVSECPQCHTKAERNVVTNACSGCKVKSPRAVARAGGYTAYTPIEECPQCHTKAERNVVTNACSGCKESKGDGRVSLSRQFAASNPDMVIDKPTAKVLGLTLYRTGNACNLGHKGWRYISTNNCLECRK